MSTQTAYENLSLDVRQGTAWIRIDRPKVLNALNRRTMEELESAVESSLADDAVGVIVITGAGEKAFVAGADIKEMAGLEPAAAQEFARFLQRVLDRIERSPKPVIAAVNGFALGGGCELAMACHVRIACESARFGQPEVNLGLIPGAAGTQRLQRIAGRGAALHMILSGEMIDAAEAHRIGLVTRVVAADQLESEVQAYADTLRGKSPMALARSLEAILAGGEVSFAEAQRIEAALFGLSFATEDMREGTRAFIEKRKPDFPGK